MRHLLILAGYILQTDSRIWCTITFCHFSVWINLVWIASSEPLRLSMQAINISFTPRFRFEESLITPRQKFALLFLWDTCIPSTSFPVFINSQNVVSATIYMDPALSLCRTLNIKPHSTVEFFGGRYLPFFYWQDYFVRIGAERGGRCFGVRQISLMWALISRETCAQTVSPIILSTPVFEPLINLLLFFTHFRFKSSRAVTWRS